MRFNRRKAFMDSFPHYMTSLAMFLLAILLNDNFPTPHDLMFKMFSTLAIIWIIPATAYLIVGAMKNA